MAVPKYLMKLIAPNKDPKAQGIANTPTYDPNRPRDQVITVPLYRDHLTDLFTSRVADDSRSLMKAMFKSDPDVSATVHSYLTLANTDPIIYVVDEAGAIDREATKLAYALISALTTRYDYSLGYQHKFALQTICERMRTMLLMSGAICAELVFDKTMAPSEIRILDTATVQWLETAPGLYKPVQQTTGGDKPISLDVPSFFVSYYRADPTTVYPHGPFISAINTIAARTQVINDLYRLMQITGYPRLSITVVEEVLRNAAPLAVRNDAKAMDEYIAARMQAIAGALAVVRPDQPLIFTDAVQVGMVNDKNPAAALDIKSVIDVLNAQNQAALKTMPTVLGRGIAGVNTASVEARLSAMNADELNGPVAEILSNLLTYGINIAGNPGRVMVLFRKAELRPMLELEPQFTMKASRLRQDLSDGIIDDDWYHLEMYGEIRPDDAPELSGTGFMTPTTVGVDEKKVSPNGDPLGRGLAPKGSKTARSNTVKKN